MAALSLPVELGSAKLWRNLPSRTCLHANDVLTVWPSRNIVKGAFQRLQRVLVYTSMLNGILNSLAKHAFHDNAFARMLRTRV
ncbi:MAG TPA: hypothetical protein GX507_02080 [Clostridia bacterium]|nr:hypothetical protein [Clostridia bacterium]